MWIWTTATRTIRLFSGTAVITATKSPTHPKRKLSHSLPKKSIGGKWSNGDERKQKLTEAGYNYSAVQKKVNELCEKMKIDEVAQEAIQGKWGQRRRKTAETHQCRI